MFSARSADNRSVSFAGVGNDTASLRGGKPGRKLLRTRTGLPLSDGQAARLAYHLGSAASATSGALPIEGNSSVFWQSEIARPSRRTVTFGPSVLFYGLSNFLDLRGGRAYCTIPPRKADVRLRAPDPNTASAQSVAPDDRQRRALLPTSDDCWDRRRRPCSAVVHIPAICASRHRTAGRPRPPSSARGRCRGRSKPQYAECQTPPAAILCSPLALIRRHSSPHGKRLTPKHAWRKRSSATRGTPRILR